MTDRPLLSFALFSFNQQAFIGPALEGAFAQTYSPLEIIVSDDCSTDGTFEVIKAKAAAYQGPHALKLNRNETNLGIGAHVNRVMQMCSGALVLSAGGDDVSLPARAEATFRAWDQFGRRPTSVCSSYMTISEQGTDLGLGGFRGDPGDTRPLKILGGELSSFVTARKPAVCGCSHAFTPELFSYFGPLKSDLEDLVLSFRSLAIGQILYIHEPLVRYRRHGGNVSFFAGGDDSISFDHREKRLRWVDEQTVRAYDNMLGDIETLSRRQRLTPAEQQTLLKHGRQVRASYAIERAMLDGSVFKRLLTLTKAVRNDGLNRALRLAPRLFPRPIRRVLYGGPGKARGLSPVKS